AGSGLRPFLHLVNRLSYLRWARLEDALRTDTTIFEAGFNEEEQQLYSEGVEAVTAETANVLAGNYDFGRHQRVLDLGGATRSFLLPILGQDAIIIANIIHCFPADRVLELLQRVRNVVSVPTRLLLVDFWTNAAHTEPAFSAFMAGEFLLTP